MLVHFTKEAAALFGLSPAPCDPPDTGGSTFVAAQRPSACSVSDVTIFGQASHGLYRGDRESRVEVVVIVACTMPEAPRLVHVARDLRRQYRRSDMAWRVHRSGHPFDENPHGFASPVGTSSPRISRIRFKAPSSEDVGGLHGMQKRHSGPVARKVISIEPALVIEPRRVVEVAACRVESVFDLDPARVGHDRTSPLARTHSAKPVSWCGGHGRPRGGRVGPQTSSTNRQASPVPSKGKSTSTSRSLSKRMVSVM